MIMKCDDTTQSTSCRCNILARPYVPVHTRDGHKWCTLLCTLLCMPWDCAVHHLACIVQLSGHTGMGASVFICLCGVVEYLASQNARAPTLFATLLNSTRCETLDSNEMAQFIDFKCQFHIIFLYSEIS